MLAGEACNNLQEISEKNLPPLANNIIDATNKRARYDTLLVITVNLTMHVCLIINVIDIFYKVTVC